MSKTIDAGITTAYGAAVRGGYEGTYDQFCEDLAKLADVLSEFLGFSVTVETLAAGTPATGDYDAGVLSLGIPRGETGNGIQSIVLNADYTLTVTYTNGQTWTSESIRGETGATPRLTIGTVQTLEPGQGATAEITGTPEDPVLNLGIPQGQAGASDAGAVTYNPETAYNDGTVGKAVSDLTRHLNDLETSGINAITGASVGQIIKVLTVDANGKPQTWEAVDEDRVVTVSGTTATIVAEAGVRYVCGELAELTFTPPASGLTAIRFTSGSTPTVISLLPAVDVKMPDDWTGTLDANQVYEINFEDRLGLVAQWS